ncbi:conserved membrane-spanning protein [Chitinispirillum alkaliphilum]|nr:conserved membrane-spanning protein [Chitinispirillum alkaliphilum]
MPFTGSHPAAAIPFSKLGLVLSALIVGSITPDIEYFLWFSTDRFSHSFAGIFIYSIPVGLLILLVFHKILKLPLLWLLPGYFQRRLTGVSSQFHFLPLRRFLNILFSLFIGILTHIIWDNLASREGWVSQNVAFLRMEIITFQFGTLTLIGAVRHGSSLLGLALILVWLYSWFRGAKPSRNSLFRYSSGKSGTLFILFILISSVIAGVIIASLNISGIHGLNSLVLYFELFIVAAISATIFQVLTYSVIWTFVFRKVLLKNH